MDVSLELFVLRKVSSSGRVGIPRIQFNGNELVYLQHLICKYTQPSIEIEKAQNEIEKKVKLKLEFKFTICILLVC